MTARSETRATGLVSVGYEGRSLDDFVAGLVEQGVTRLVDVRLTPISRKKGFSKTALGSALAAQGIDYEHRRELGNPKENRAGFWGSAGELDRARSHYAGLLSRPASAEALEALAESAAREVVAVLCFEADEHRCHRQVVVEALRPRLRAAASTRRER
jgi:uncharacterized protein (DUF488 family)